MTEATRTPGATSNLAGRASLIPRCARCHRLHLSTLSCWAGRYAQRVTATVYREKGRLCWACRREGRRTHATTVDHVHPRSLGGTDELRNLEPACKRHNSGKGNRISSPYPSDVPIAGNGQPVSGRFR